MNNKFKYDEVPEDSFEEALEKATAITLQMSQQDQKNQLELLKSVTYCMPQKKLSTEEVGRNLLKFIESNMSVVPDIVIVVMKLNINIGEYKRIRREENKDNEFNLSTNKKIVSSYVTAPTVSLYQSIEEGKMEVYYDGLIEEEKKMFYQNHYDDDSVQYEDSAEDKAIKKKIRELRKSDDVVYVAKKKFAIEYERYTKAKNNVDLLEELVTKELTTFNVISMVENTMGILANKVVEAVGKIDNQEIRTLLSGNVTLRHVPDVQVMGSLELKNLTGMYQILFDKYSVSNPSNFLSDFSDYIAYGLSLEDSNKGFDKVIANTYRMMQKWETGSYDKYLQKDMLFSIMFVHGFHSKSEIHKELLKVMYKKLNSEEDDRSSIMSQSPTPMLDYLMNFINREYAPTVNEISGPGSKGKKEKRYENVYAVEGESNVKQHKLYKVVLRNKKVAVVKHRLINKSEGIKVDGKAYTAREQYCIQCADGAQCKLRGTGNPCGNQLCTKCQLYGHYARDCDPERK